MADAPTLEAPLKKTGAFPEFKFDPNKKYIFELAVQNEERELPVVDMGIKRPAPHKKFNPYRNIVFTSQIVYEGERRTIRYYDGCTSLFVDEQPKEKQTIDDLISRSKRRIFQDGRFFCYGDDRMLLLYLNVCSWNADSKYRTRTADAIFVSVNKDVQAAAEESRLDKIEEASKLAREASYDKVLMHSAFLGLDTMDYDTGNEMTEKEIRIQYRQAAANTPQHFIDSYGNKDIEIKYYINKALVSGIINTSTDPNKAMWNKGRVICDISGFKTQDGIQQKIFEFAQTEQGEEFKIQLTGLYNKK